MQSKLPDLNNAMNLHRISVMRAFDELNWTKLVIEVRAYNAILPDDYALKFSTIDYNVAIKSERKWKCLFCAEAFLLESIQIYSQIIPLIIRKITHDSRAFFWNCPSCHRANDRKATQETRIIASDPKYVGVIPLPPNKYGIADPNLLQKNFQLWYEIAITELEHAVAKLRHEYVTEEGTEFDISADAEDVDSQ